MDQITAHLATLVQAATRALFVERRILLKQAHEFVHSVDPGLLTRASRNHIAESSPRVSEHELDDTKSEATPADETGSFEYEDAEIQENNIHSPEELLIKLKDRLAHHFRLDGRLWRFTGAELSQTQLQAVSRDLQMLHVYVIAAREAATAALQEQVVNNLVGLEKVFSDNVAVVSSGGSNNGTDMLKRTEFQTQMADLCARLDELKTLNTTAAGGFSTARPPAVRMR